MAATKKIKDRTDCRDRTLNLINSYIAMTNTMISPKLNTKEGDKSM